MEPTSAIGKFERYGLRLVFGGPVWTWVSLASLIGVKVNTSGETDESLLAVAESQAKVAASRFAVGAPATMLLTLLLILVLPKQTLEMRRLFFYVFDVVTVRFLGRGFFWWIAEAFASASVFLIAALAGLLNAVVFGAVPVFLLRRTALAAAPVVSLALSTQSGQVDKAKFERFPRVALAVETILGPRRRPRKG